MSTELIIPIDERGLGAFEVKIRINDIGNNTCTPDKILSTISWERLQEKLLETFNVHFSGLHVQYRLSTEKKDALYCDLTSQKQLDTLIDFIRPKRGNSKLPIVDLYNKCDIRAEAEGKVGILIFLRIESLLTVLSYRRRRENKRAHRTRVHRSLTAIRLPQIKAPTQIRIGKDVVKSGKVLPSFITAQRIATRVRKQCVGRTRTFATQSPKEISTYGLIYMYVILLPVAPNIN